MKQALDAKDLKIVELLKKDARLSVRKLAKLTGLKPSTVHVRIQKLLKEKIVEYSVKVSSDALNENFVGFVFISTDKELEKETFSDSKIKEVFSITGEYDTLVKARCRDSADFNSLVSKLKSKPGIKKMLTNVAMGTIKE